jgi:cell fate (sporulation/competence/biofilm development) regulator YmcA (YheA/YmcA/DUF963 family)
MADTTVSVETKLVGAQEIAQGFKDIAKSADEAKDSVAAIGKTDTTSGIDSTAASIVDAFKKASDEAVKLKTVAEDAGKSVTSIGAGSAAAESPLVKKFRESQEAAAKLKETTLEVGRAVDTASGGSGGESPLVKKFRESQEAATKLKDATVDVGKAVEKDIGEKGVGGISGLTKAAAIAAIGVTAVAAAAGYAALKVWDLVKSSAAYAEKLFDVNQATGRSVESLQGWDLAARQSGTSLDSVVATMNRLTISLFRGAGTGGQGAGRLKHILEAVGIDPKSVKDGEDALFQIADVMRTMTPTDRINVAMSLGISTDMIQMLSQGSVEIKRLADETNSMRIISTETAAAQDLLSDSFVRTKFLIMGIGNEILNEFIEPVAKAAARWIDSIVAMGSVWTAFGTLISRGLPGGERFVEGLESGRAKVSQLTKELDDMYEKQARGGNRLDVARREQRMEALRVEINAAKALVAEYERVLEVTTKREEANQPFIGPPRPAVDPFSRERKGSRSDPSDNLRDMIEKAQRELAMAANAIDNSPEARQWYEASHGIISKYEKSQTNEDPKLRIQLKLVQEAMIAEMDLFVQRRETRLKKMGEQDAERVLQAELQGAALLEAQQKALDALEEAERKHFESIAKAARDAADPLGGFIREIEKTNEAVSRLGIKLSSEEMTKLQEGVARGFNGMAKEAKESNKAFDELIRAVEGFGKQFTDSLYTSFEQGGNIIDAFFSNMGKLAAKRALYEAVGKPIDNMIQGVIQQFIPNTQNKQGGGGSDAGIIGLILRGLIGGASGGGGASAGGGEWGGVDGVNLGSFTGYNAKGGYIPPGYSGIVGESGYEMITAGETGVRVTPLGGGSSTNYYNITVESGTDRSRTVMEVQRAIAAAQAAQYADLYRGGAMSQLLSTTGRA